MAWLEKMTSGAFSRKSWTLPTSLAKTRCHEMVASRATSLNANKANKGHREKNVPFLGGRKRGEFIEYKT